jgi:predicted nucleic acid-binding protein
VARLILDSGVLLGVERGDATVRGWLEEAFTVGPPPVVPTAVIAESWRGGTRQSWHVRRLLTNCRIEPLTDEIARLAGELLTSAGNALDRKGGSRVVDAVVVITASRFGDTILTSDSSDLSLLAIDFPALHVEQV